MKIEKLKKINNFGADITKNDEVYLKINEIIEYLEKHKHGTITGEPYKDKGDTNAK